MKQVEIPRMLQEMQGELGNTLTQLKRLEKGEQVIAERAMTNAIEKAHEAILLFNRLSRDLNNNLESALFMHEIMVTGRTTLITRDGRPVNPISYRKDETVFVDESTLESIRELKEVFKEFPVKQREMENSRIIQTMHINISDLKAALQRLDKGQKVIAKHAREYSIIKAHEAIELYNKLSKDLNKQLEYALFMHELMAAGCIVYITKEGEVTEPSTQENTDCITVDKFVLDSIVEIEQLLGEGFKLKFEE